MDKGVFVQNVKKFCELKGVKPTVACREAGVSTSFITNIQKGQTPSVEKVQLLAAYLGVTVSDLLGEERPATPEGDGLSAVDRRFKELLSDLTPQEKALALSLIESVKANRQK